MPLDGYNDEVYKEYSSAKHRLGTEMRFPDGRRFRFALNGASALAAGALVQMPVPAANHNNIAVAAAAAIGATEVSVTLGATAAAKDLYKDGWLYVNDVTGEGHLYPIKEHAAIGSAGTGTIKLRDNAKLAVALTTSSQVTLIRNPYAAVIIHPSVPTALPVGVAPIAVTASYYFWCQVAGPAVVLTDGTVVIAQEVMASNAVDGSVEAWGLTEGTPNVAITPPVGRVISVNADTEYSLIMLHPLD